MKSQSKEKIINYTCLRAVSDGVKSKIGFSPISTGVYAASRMYEKTKNTILVTALIRNIHRYTPKEMVLLEDTLLNPEGMSESITKFCKQSSAKAVIVAMHRGNEQLFPLKASVCVHLEENLRLHGIVLYGYYLTDGIEFEDLT